MRAVTGIIILAAALLPPLGAWADGNGLATDTARVPWASLHGRIDYTVAPSWRGDFSFANGSGLTTSAVSVMGDLYFGASASTDKLKAGGFRATGGIVVGARNNLWGTPGAAPASGLLSVNRRLFGQSPAVSLSAADASADSATLPYIGIGYSSLAARSGWSFSADLGLVSLNPGNAVRFGRVFVGGQNFDDVVHDMHLSPVLQLGVSYSF
ncbi:MAG: hypothetical protein ABI330_02655 [Caldimonas sp.]